MLSACSFGFGGYILDKEYHMFPLCFLHISGAYPSQFHGGLEGHSIPKLPIQPIHPRPPRAIKIQIGKDLLHLCLMRGI